jgi:hypothetical protein
MKDPKRVAAGKRSKSKGKVFERRIANLLKEAGYESERGWSQSTGGARIPDVVLEGWWIECGNGEQMDPVAKLRQAQEYIGAYAVKPDVIPVSITKRNRKVIEVCIDSHDLMRLNAPCIPVRLAWDDFLMLVAQRQPKPAPVPSKFEE